MRLSLIEKLSLFGGLFSFCLLIIVVNRNYSSNNEVISVAPPRLLKVGSLPPMQKPQPSLFDDISCVINGLFEQQNVVKCLRGSDDEIYLPFGAFLQRYYETYGLITKNHDGENIFEFWHTKARLVRPKFDVYDPKGVFGSFGNYNVEHRERVKLISGQHGVPLSTQWNVEPYFYSVQIAQYALEHYSKNITKPPRLESLFPYEDVGLWNGGHIQLSADGKSIDFRTKLVAEIKFPHIIASKWPVLRLFLKLTTNDTSGFKVKLRKVDTQVVYEMYYLKTDSLIRVDESNKIVYGIGKSCCVEWTRLTRNLVTDFAKGILLSRKKIKKSANMKNISVRLELISFSLIGQGSLKYLSQRTSSHDDHFFDAVDFLIAHQQSESGAFAVPVERSLAEGQLTLKPGWVSAMAQGHFISAACRAYHRTSNEKYKLAALSALRPFHLNVSSGGIRAMFLKETPWFEEYPTQPYGTFVLNGFVYSLIGLYDGWKLCQDEQGEARDLYLEGLKSLRLLLPLFDTGSGSLYDLKHFSLAGKVAPNVARWDYHAVHIYQLLWMHLIEKDSTLFAQTAQRWIGYMRGKRAKHN